MTTPARQPQHIRIHRTWAMPNKNTFQIPQIKNLIDRFGWDWVDPFPDPYQRDALEYLKGFKDNSVSYLLFDPPYSPRQLKECYESNGQSLHDTTSAVWRRWKDEIARVMKPNGICISFGWSSNGIGLKRGFEIVEILLVAHGGNHNDTMCVVEQKTSATHTSPPAPDICESSAGCEHVKYAKEQAAKAEREKVDKLLNSRISKMEIINSKKPTQFREGALMAYRDIEESLRAQQQEQP